MMMTRAGASLIVGSGARGRASGSEILQDFADLIGLGELLVEQERASERARGEILLAEAVVVHPEVVLDRRVVVRELGRLLQQGLRPVVLTALVIDEPE